MAATQTASRRSLIRSFFATVAAAGAGLFGVGHAKASAQTSPQAGDMTKKTSTDAQPPGAQPVPPGAPVPPRTGHEVG